MVARVRSPLVGAAAASTLGVTAMFGGLWLLAAGPGLAHGQLIPLAAAALDPGSAGSLVDCWAIGLLALATLLALSWPGSRLLALTPAMLLLGETGEFHVRWAHLLAGPSAGSGALLIAKVAVSLDSGGLGPGAAAAAREPKLHRRPRPPATAYPAALRRRHSGCRLGPVRAWREPAGPNDAPQL